jgi:predicted nucleotide-binding protein
VILLHGSNRRVFISYARGDIEIARSLTQSLRVLSIDAWLDVDSLVPGERFDRAIRQGLSTSDALVFLVTPSSLASPWVERELTAFAESSHRPLIPVVVAPLTFADLPERLRNYQALLLSGGSDVAEVAEKIAAAVHRLEPDTTDDDADLLAKFASDLATEARGAPSLPLDSTSMFLVYGHDREFREEVEEYVRTRGYEPVVLERKPGSGVSILSKFLDHASKAQLALVLLSPDDLAISKLDYDALPAEDRVHQLQFRARENVILELGFFYGKLGFENVFVVMKRPSKRFPRFETPSDLGGLYFTNLDAEFDWRVELDDFLSGLVDRVPS